MFEYSSVLKEGGRSEIVFQVEGFILSGGGIY